MVNENDYHASNFYLYLIIFPNSICNFTPQIATKNVFSAGVHIAGSLLYLLKGSADEQKWAVPVQQKSAEGLEKQDTKIRV